MARAGPDVGHVADGSPILDAARGSVALCRVRVSAARAAAELAGVVAPERAVIVVVDADRDRGIAIFRNHADHPSWGGAVPGGHGLSHAPSE